MASTQRVTWAGGVTWTVVDAHGKVIVPVESYLDFARQSDYSPNTIRSYAKSRALWSTHLQGRDRDWNTVQLTDFGAFLQALRTGEVGYTTTALRPAATVADSTVAARVRPVMSFYRFHAAMGVQAASFLYEQVNARPGRYLRFLEHVARRQGRRRSRVRVRVRPREVPVLEPAAVTALISAEATRDKGSGEWSGDLRYRLLWTLLTETGMRIGEALSLQHRDWTTGCGDTASIQVVPRPHPHGLQLKSGARRVFVGSRLDRVYGDYVWWLASGTSRSSWMGSVRTFIIGRPRHLPAHRRADHLYTVICDELGYGSPASNRPASRTTNGERACQGSTVIFRSRLHQMSEVIFIEAQASLAN